MTDAEKVKRLTSVLESIAYMAPERGREMSNMAAMVLNQVKDAEECQHARTKKGRYLAWPYDDFEEVCMDCGWRTGE